MKIIIPIAGTGTRMRPHTLTTAKALLPVAGKPMIDFIVDKLVELNFSEIIFIVGYLGEQIELYIKQKFPSIKSMFLEQRIRGGLGHAILMAKEYAYEEEVLIILGDTIIETDYKKLISSNSSKIAVVPVDDPKRYGIVEVDGEKIISLVEKPDYPPTNLAIAGIYYIKESSMLFDSLTYLKDNRVTTKGELQITDALARMLNLGVTFETFHVDKWLDCGKIETTIETNKDLLTINGTYVDESVNTQNSIIIEPVYIDKNTEIYNSVIGPFVSIGSSSTIKDSVINNSIIGNNSVLEGLLANKSMIGNNCEIIYPLKFHNYGDYSIIKPFNSME